MKSSKDVVETDLEYICSNTKDDLESLAGKRLLIAGGAGFLGYYLVQALLHWNKTRGGDQAVHVTVCDNYSRGMPGWLTSLASDANLQLIKHDVTLPLPNDIEEFHYVIHAASIASPTYYRQHPIETMDANVNGLRALLEHCRRQKERNNEFKGFLFFSSSEIYGDPSPDSIPTSEAYRGYVSCTGPRACYDESKRYGETLCVNFAQEYGLQTRVARPFNNYGPGLKISDRRAIPDFARDVLEGRDIVLLSDGGPTRTFCYVSDAIIGYFKILIKGRDGEAYNIGVEQPEISIAELADRVAALGRELFSYKGRVIHRISPDRDYLVDNPKRRCPTIAKARAELGYNPRVELDDGLRRSLIWYSDNREAADA